MSVDPGAPTAEDLANEQQDRLRSNFDCPFAALPAISRQPSWQAIDWRASAAQSA